MAPNTAPSDTPTYSLVVPIYNEEAVLPLFIARIDVLLSLLGGTSEVVLVNDGSTDGTLALAQSKAKADPRWRVIDLSRNFGQQIAMTAGLDMARGRAVIMMDADLQDPPEVAFELAAKWKEGFDVVYAQRASRDQDTWLKRTTAKWFYRGMKRLSSVDIPDSVGDFKLIDRKVVEAFKAMPERERWVRGMFCWVGFKQAVVPYAREARAAGETKYSYWKLARLAVNAVVSFSDAPLRLAIWMGLAVSGMAVAYGLWVIGQRLFDAQMVSGWASTMVVMTFLFGANLLTTGVVGLYVGRIHAEVKRRPLYLVDSLTGFDRAGETSRDEDVRSRAA